jgi:hypothetical protein
MDILSWFFSPYLSIFDFLKNRGLSMAKIKAKTKSKSKLQPTKKRAAIKPKKSSEPPVTISLLDRLKADNQRILTSTRFEEDNFLKEFNQKLIDIKFEARFNQLDAKFESKFSQLNTKFEPKLNQLNSKLETTFSQLYAKLGQLDSKFEHKFARIESLLQRILVCNDIKNVRNKFALDYYAQLYDRLEENKTEFKKQISNIELQLSKLK